MEILSSETLLSIHYHRGDDKIKKATKFKNCEFNFNTYVLQLKLNLNQLGKIFPNLAHNNLKYFGNPCHIHKI